MLSNRLAKTALLAFAGLSLWTTQAPGQFSPTTAGGLEVGCRPIIEPQVAENRLLLLESGRCSGIMQTVLALAPSLSPELAFCPPPTVAPWEAAGVFVDHVEGHPEVRQMDAIEIVIDAFRIAWPC